MTPQAATDLFSQAFLTAFWMSLPILLIGFVVGVVISLIQTLTAIQDPAVGALPRLLGYLVALLLFLPWILTKAMTYTTDILGHLARYAH